MPEMNEEQRKALEEKIKNMSPEELREFQKQQCIFCQIIAGKVPAKKIYEDEKSVAVLDINPAAKGHILILPKEHYAIMPQVPDHESGHLFLVVKALSQILLRALKVSGTSIFIANGLAAGQKAQHFMIHLIPRKEGDDFLILEEKWFAESVRQQVKAVVQPRLQELLGVKKEVFVQKTLPPVAPQEEAEEEATAEETKEESVEEQVEEQVEEKTEEEIEEVSVEEAAEELEEMEEAPLKKSALKKKSIAKKQPGKKHEKKKVNSHEKKDYHIPKKESKKETKKETKKEHKSEKKEKVSLDDIAHLFR